jgi:hypothetical protein
MLLIFMLLLRRRGICTMVCFDVSKSAAVQLGLTADWFAIQMSFFSFGRANLVLSAKSKAMYKTYRSLTFSS